LYSLKRGVTIGVKEVYWITICVAVQVGVDIAGLTGHVTSQPAADARIVGAGGAQIEAAVGQVHEAGVGEVDVRRARLHLLPIRAVVVGGSRGRREGPADRALMIDTVEQLGANRQVFTLSQILPEHGSRRGARLAYLVTAPEEAPIGDAPGVIVGDGRATSETVYNDLINSSQ